MADDLQIIGGIIADGTLAADDVGGKLYEKIKVDAGGDGLSVPIVAGQQVAAASLPVVVASDQSTLAVSMAAVPTGGSTAAHQVTQNTALSAIQTAVEALDNTVAGSELQVDVVTSALPSGAATAAKQPALGTAGVSSTDVISVQGIASGTALPVSMAAVPTGGATAANQTTIIGHVDGIEGLLTTIDGDTGTLAGAVSGSEMQVDVVGALPAGTNNIGDVDVASIAAGDNNIGNVDIVSGTITTVSTVTNLAQQGGVAISLNTGVRDTGTQRVTIATNDVVPVSQSGTWDEVGINDSGNSITVDAPVGTPVFVRLSDGSSAIATLPVSLASVPSHAVTNAGTFAVQVDGAALTALQLIDNFISGSRGLVTEDNSAAIAASLSVIDDWDSADAAKTVGIQVTVTTSVTRPANTTAYAINDAWADSDSAPTAGGFTFTSAARASGGSGIITDAIITNSGDPAIQLQGEIYIFDTSVTAINDNAAFAITDAESQTIVAKIPFACEDIGNQGFYHAQNLAIGFTAVGSANLRFLIRVKNAYAPAANSDVLTCRLKIIQTT